MDLGRRASCAGAPGVSSRRNARSQRRSASAVQTQERLGCSALPLHRLTIAHLLGVDVQPDARPWPGASRERAFSGGGAAATRPA